MKRTRTSISFKNASSKTTKYYVFISNRVMSQFNDYRRISKRMGNCEVWQKFVIIISKAGSDETVVNGTAYDNIPNLHDTFQYAQTIIKM